MDNRIQIANYQDLLEMRRKYNTELFVDASAPDSAWRLVVEAGRQTLTADVDRGTGNIDAIVATYGNKPIASEEYRFLTHEFDRPATWDGRTNGDCAHSWAFENGATGYDDVNYRFVDDNGAPICHLDAVEGGAGSVWKSDANNPVVLFNPTTSHWERQDNSANTTSSRWSIVPYPNTKMALIIANSEFHKDAVIQDVAQGVKGALRYIVSAYFPAGYYPPNPSAPSGLYPVKQFVYQTPDLLALAANTRETDTVTGVKTANYDYRVTTIFNIDARLGMQLDIQLDGHLPVQSATPCQAEFIGNKITSF